MEKRGVLGIFALVFATLLAANVLAIELDISSANFISDSNFVITALKYEPYPVSPGEQFDIWVKVENKGTQSVPNATCILKPDYPFSIYQGSATKSYGALPPGKDVVFQYKLKVDEKALQGSNELQIWCAKDPTLNAWAVQKIPVLVQTRYPTLNIKEIKTVPETISPGKEAVLSFTLENLADSAMKDIKITLDLPEVDIAPSGEISEKKLRMIDAGSTADLSFKIMALPTSNGGIYKVPFTLSYTDYYGTSYIQTGLISIGVSSKPQIIISIDSSTLSKSSRIGEVDIELTNMGLTDLKFMSAEIKESEDYKILSSNSFYIGDIDSDDSGTATFKLSVKTGDDFSIPLTLSFRDVLNNDYSEDVNVNFKMLSNSELGKKTLAGSIITGIIVLFLLLMLFIRSFREKVVGLFSGIFRKK